MAHDLTIERENKEQNYFRPDNQKVRWVAQTIEHGYFTNYADFSWTYPVNCKRKATAFYTNICKRLKREREKPEEEKEGEEREREKKLCGERERRGGKRRGKINSIKFAFIRVQMTLK